MIKKSSNYPSVPMENLHLERLQQAVECVIKNTTRFTIWKSELFPESQSFTIGFYDLYSKGFGCLEFSEPLTSRVLRLNYYLYETLGETYKKSFTAKFLTQQEASELDNYLTGDAQFPKTLSLEEFQEDFDAFLDLTCPWFNNLQSFEGNVPDYYISLEVAASYNPTIARQLAENEDDDEDYDDDYYGDDYADYLDEDFDYTYDADVVESTEAVAQESTEAVTQESTEAVAQESTEAVAQETPQKTEFLDIKTIRPRPSSHNLESIIEARKVAVDTWFLFVWLFVTLSGWYVAGVVSTLDILREADLETLEAPELSKPTASPLGY